MTNVFVTELTCIPNIPIPLIFSPLKEVIRFPREKTVTDKDSLQLFGSYRPSIDLCPVPNEQSVDIDHFRAALNLDWAPEIEGLGSSMPWDGLEVSFISYKFFGLVWKGCLVFVGGKCFKCALFYTKIYNKCFKIKGIFYWPLFF